jgi:hypothetical protein
LKNKLANFIHFPIIEDKTFGDRLMYMFSVIMCFHIVRPYLLQTLHLTGWFVQGEYFDGSYNFFTGKLGLFDFAKSCFEFPLSLVNITKKNFLYLYFSNPFPLDSEGLIYGIYFHATSWLLYVCEITRIYFTQ